MDKVRLTKCSEPGDQSVKDITVCLRNNEGVHKLFIFNACILKSKSLFFANQLSSPNSNSCIEINCSVVDYHYYVELLNLLYLPPDSLVDTWRSVNSALGILQVAVALQCDEITQSCVNYLEAAPWEDKEEEDILRIVPKLGDVAMPILSRVKPIDSTSTKNVFIAAVRYAMAISVPCPPFGDEIRISAQEQIEYMLGEDEETPLVMADEEVKSEVRKGLSQMICSFEKALSSLLLMSETYLMSETAESSVLHSLASLEWSCHVLPKMNLMRDFVTKWAEISNDFIGVIEDRKLKSVMWRLKFKLIEVSSKVLEAVGYGNVICPPTCRLQLLKTWLPYIRKMKPILDNVGNKEIGFQYKMDEDLCQTIQGAIVSLIVALPSCDQAEILADWMENEPFGYPDLTEAFEIWCYRTKSSKRRLVEGLEGASNGSVSSDLSV